MTSSPPTDLTAHPWFFCGIGGSGMLPLATILKGLGAQVAGSDRSRDQGRTPEKFASLEAQGFTLYPQDGSGIVSADQTLVASAAIEDTVPEVVRAKGRGCPRMTRAELLATLLNAAVMKNFVSPDTPFASAKVGAGNVFVSEVDESDGSIALYRPQVAVLLNVSLDHKSMEELRALFSQFVLTARRVAANADDEEARLIAAHAGEVITFGIISPDATLSAAADSIEDTAT